MKISSEWLKQYVDLKESLQQIMQDLSMIGLVVEGVEEHGTDVVLEIEVTSNRPDCLSHIGIAREVAALYGEPLRMPAVKRSLRARRERIPYSIEIFDPALCPRYVGLVMDGIRVGPSPDWMRRRLESAGMRPLNNIVDITNYVLLEMGHPLHAFDFSLLRGGKIVVARATEGQSFVTLDGIERTLDGETLVINDGEGPVAIAGVMGGLNSEISHSTTTVLLECAYFQPGSVRRTSKKLGLSSEASYRFERGADWGDPAVAIARTCALIEELAGGKIAGSVQDVCPRPIEPVRIELRRSRAERLLGVALTDELVESTLRKLDFKLLRKGKGAWLATCPSYRSDMELEADLIEEVARFYGYQNIPTTVPAARGAGESSPARPLESAVRRMLLGLGYSEAVNLSFAPARATVEFPTPGVERVVIRNPLTEETQFLRTALAQGLVLSAKRNLNRDIRDIRLFEIGKVYSLGPGGRPVERNTLGILGTGSPWTRNWLSSPPPFDYFHLRGALAALLQGLRSAEYSVEPCDGPAWLDPADASRILVGGRQVGILGSLHPRLEQEYKLRQGVCLAEIDLESLQPAVFRPAKHLPLAKFPSVERDLSIVMAGQATYGQVRDGILGLGFAELRSVDLIDVYEGGSVPAGKVSMTLRFTFQDPERTLTIDRVQALSDNIVTYLRDHYGAELR